MRHSRILPRAYETKAGTAFSTEASATLSTALERIAAQCPPRDLQDVARKALRKG